MISVIKKSNNKNKSEDIQRSGKLKREVLVFLVSFSYLESLLLVSVDGFVVVDVNFRFEHREVPFP